MGLGVHCSPEPLSDIPHQGFPAAVFNATDVDLDFVIPSFLATGCSTLEIDSPTGLLIAPIYIDLPPGEGSVWLIACDEVPGRTVEYIGTVKGGSDDLGQLTDLGVNSYDSRDGLEVV